MSTAPSMRIPLSRSYLFSFHYSSFVTFFPQLWEEGAHRADEGGYNLVPHSLSQRYPQVHRPGAISMIAYRPGGPCG
jgi:hypothetical protein